MLEAAEVEERVVGEITEIEIAVVNIDRGIFESRCKV